MFTPVGWAKGRGCGDGGDFPDDVGGLTARSATSVLDYDLQIMSAFTFNP